MSKKQADIHPTEADRKRAKLIAANALRKYRRENWSRAESERALKDLEKRLRKEGRT